MPGEPEPKELTLDAPIARRLPVWRDFSAPRQVGKPAINPLRNDLIRHLRQCIAEERRRLCQRLKAQLAETADQP